MIAVVALSRAAAFGNSDDIRTDRSIGQHWSFLRQDAPGADAVQFDDSKWSTVDVPHTWTQETVNGHATYYRGVSWYRHHLKIEPTTIGRRLFLRFGAAAGASDIFVNGTQVGTHKGSYGAFCVEITNAAHSGDNLVAVRLDNAPDKDVAPLSGDFTMYGGLFRSVHFLALDPIHISPTDDAGPGVYLSSSVDHKIASISATCKLSNQAKAGMNLTIVGTITDADNKVVASNSATQRIDAGADDQVTLKLTIQDPHLWDGRADPYLYKTTIELRDGDKVLDRVSQSLGIRTFKVNPNTGLTLNGHPYDFHGVNYHEGRPTVGSAYTPEMQAEDHQLIYEMGCTGVRMAHYQHDEGEYALCDKSGLIVWTELALVNRMTNSTAFRENIKQQLRELIKQNYNHPSIFFWSMYNEVWVADKGKGNTAEDWKLVEELVALAHELDPNRLTTGAAVNGVGGAVSFYMDVTGMNRYDGWYSGKPEDWLKTIESLHSKFPDKNLGVSEYGAGASVNQHSAATTKPKPDGKWHPEEWQCIVHEHAWNALRQDPRLWCKLIWCMFDFDSAGRNEGDAIGINDKGLVTADRKTRKDSYFFYKACWTTEPLVYIADRRFNPRPAATVALKVYSNCASVELTLNNRSLGKQVSEDHVFHWIDIPLSAGDNKVEAIGTNGESTTHDTVSWKVLPE